MPAIRDRIRASIILMTAFLAACEIYISESDDDDDNGNPTQPDAGYWPDDDGGGYWPEPDAGGWSEGDAGGWSEGDAGGWNEGDAGCGTEPGGDAGAPACPGLGTLTPIAGGEAPFQLCASDADCDPDYQHFCYHAPGALGFCQVADADIWCDGEGDVNLQAVPPVPGWGPGVCVWQDWKDYLCCNAPGSWDC
jgi:hypothetical protein